MKPQEKIIKDTIDDSECNGSMMPANTARTWVFNLQMKAIGLIFKSRNYINLLLQTITSQPLY